MSGKSPYSAFKEGLTESSTQQWNDNGKNDGSLKLGLQKPSSTYKTQPESTINNTAPMWYSTITVSYLDENGDLEVVSGNNHLWYKVKLWRYTTKEPNVPEECQRALSKGEALRINGDRLLLWQPRKYSDLKLNKDRQGQAQLRDVLKVSNPEAVTLTDMQCLIIIANEEWSEFRKLLKAEYGAFLDGAVKADGPVCADCIENVDTERLRDF